ncbi:hypothetical protein [Herbiconiux daphne]|uniref:Uncharacterized protein n=1 Tax=Herbiconiux daphne TaxID=2970914 RepID=A0ABT2H9J5_9MICO|nr:hypothetical protein [Herbiconiux daphne]MCS5736630.1 hypothetical protein [Herbiconiux daphne]
MIDQEDRAPSTITGQIEPQGMPTDFNAPIGRVDVEGENPLLHLNPDRIARKEASKAEQKAGLVGKFDNVPNEEKPDRSRITAGLKGCVVVELLEE